MKNYYDIEIEETNKQIQKDLGVLNNILYKMTRATTEKEVLNFMIRATYSLNNVFNGKAYLISLNGEKNDVI